MRVAIPAGSLPWISLWLWGCTASRTGFDGTKLDPLTEDERAVQSELVIQGADDRTAEACARLGSAIGQRRVGSALDHEISGYFSVYCGDFAPSETGFEACYGDNRSRFLDLNPSEHCRQEVPSMLFCLSSAEEVEECDAYRPDPPCEAWSLLGVPFADTSEFECSFESGGFEIARDEVKKAVVIDCKNTTTSQSFRVHCGVPDESCSSACFCLLDGVNVRAFDAKEVHDDSFVDDALAMCKVFGRMKSP